MRQVLIRIQSKIRKKKMKTWRYTFHNTLSTLIILFAFVQGGFTTQYPEIPPLDDTILSEIFHQNKIYTLYVVSDILKHKQEHSIFKQFCSEYRAQCTLVDDKSEKYQVMRSFIGVDKEHYFCILDFARRKKYLLPVVEGMTVTDLIIFQSKFEQGILEIFYASEEPDIEPYEPCRKVVGKDLEDFLLRKAPVKVLLLYTMNSACEYCPELLRNYSILAQKMYDQNRVIFGYFDIFLNDNSLIPDQMMGHFLLFQNDLQESPISLSGDNFSKLQNKILNLLGEQSEGFTSVGANAEGFSIDFGFEAIENQGFATEEENANEQISQINKESNNTEDTYDVSNQEL